MNQTILHDLSAWLTAAPSLADITLTTDELSPCPGQGGLYPQGVTVTRRTENLWGGQTRQCRAEFLLRLVLPAATAAANADRVTALQDWVNARRDHPRLGNADLSRETLTASEGRLEQTDAEGTNRYSLRLTAEFTDKEETNED